MSSLSDDLHVSRRGLFRGVFTGAAGLGAVALPIAEAEAGPEGRYPSSDAKPAEFDFSKYSNAMQADQVIDSACQFCNSLCRLKVSLRDGRIIDVRGETDDPVQLGGLCVKANLMTQLVYNRFRLKKPMKRVGGEKGSPDSKFEPISWDEALTTIAKQFLALRDAGEARSIANKTSGRLLRGTGSVIGRFFSLLGSPNDTDVGPVCNDAGGNALGWSFGMGNFTNGYGIDAATGKEDLGSAKFFLFLGTNQAETPPVTFAYLLRERAKTKAKLVVIDPRLTPTGGQADEWLSPKPHTDLAIVLAMLHHILTKELYDKAFVDKWVLGFKELAAHVKDKQYTPEWAAEMTGVPADKIRQVAEGYAAAKPAAIFCNAGISHQLNAFDTYRALAFLAAITGNIGVNGGGCNFMHNTWPGGLNLSAVKEAMPKKDVALPVGPDYFAESILTGKPNSVTHVYANGGRNVRIVAKVTDDVRILTATPLLVRISDQAQPSLSIAGPSSFSEAAFYTLSLSGKSASGNPISKWTINWGDGSPLQTVQGNPKEVVHIFPEGARRYTIQATATDRVGTYNAENSVTVDIRHARPNLELTGASTTNEQSLYTLRLASQTSGPHFIKSWTINWGDGSAPQVVTGNPSSVTHEFKRGPHTFTISAIATTDVGSFHAQNNVVVNVKHVAPRLTLQGAKTIMEGSTYTLNLSAVTARSHDLKKWVINWGDGSAPQTVSGSATLVTHVFRGVAKRTITATATDDIATFNAGNSLVVTVNRAQGGV